MFQDDAAYFSDVDQSLPLRVLPLYSLLSPDKQRLVFDPVPEGYRYKDQTFIILVILHQSEWRGPSTRLSAWETQLRRNVAAVVSR